MSMFRKQFLLSTIEEFGYGFSKIALRSKNLFYHPELPICQSTQADKKIILIGNIYSYQHPEYTNQAIANELINNKSKSELLAATDPYCGEYVIIYETADDYILFNDASAQQEIYYDANFEHYGSQPKILEEVIQGVAHKDKEAKDFYNSKCFKKKSLFIMDTTHFENIKHLITNHYIDLKRKSIVRFFPTKQIPSRTIHESAQNVVTMLGGFMKAFANRSPLAIAVTGGYDSRILFLLSLELEVKYFVLEHPHMGPNHYDVTIPTRLTNLFGKEFHVLKSDQEAKAEFDDNFIKSIDFPRKQNTFPTKFKGRLFVNGNISEVAREFFGYMNDCTGEDLAFLSKYNKHPFPSKMYQAYRDQNKSGFEAKGIHWLSMFYWEERMGNWVSKAKTESNAMGIAYTSPFNCRKIITEMWGVPRKDRDFYRSKLHAEMLKLIANKEALKIPINPSPKLEMIRWMKRLGVYNLYRKLGLLLKKY